MSDEQKFWYLFWAYDVIWLLICGYLVMLGARQRRIEKQIDRLRRSLGMDERP